MQNTISFLSRLGLSDREVLIYKTLLANGPTSISSLSKKTGIARVNIYTDLPKLLSGGFVLSSPKGKYKIFIAESPQKLHALLGDIVREGEKEIEQLKELSQKSVGKHSVTYGEGAHAIKAVFSDVVHSLKKDEMYFRYSSTSALKRESPSPKKYVPHDYHKVRDQKGLERLIITNEYTKGRKKPALGRDVKVVPREFDLFEYNISQVIYGDKVSIIDYNNETVINIENSRFAEFQRKIFKLLFKKL